MKRTAPKLKPSPEINWRRILGGGSALKITIKRGIRAYAKCDEAEAEKIFQAAVADGSLKEGSTVGVAAFIHS